MFDEFIPSNDIEYTMCPAKAQIIFSLETRQLFTNKLPEEYKDSIVEYCNSHEEFEPEKPVYLINGSKTIAVMIAPIMLPFTEFVSNLVRESMDSQI